MFDLREVPYDRYNFRTEAMNLIDEGIEAVEVLQALRISITRPSFC